MELKNKRTYIKFGEIDAPGGAMIAVRNLNEIAQVEADAMRFRLIKRGIFLTPEIEKMIDEYEAKVFRRLDENIKSKGIPKTFKDLLDATRKKEAEKVASKLVITSEDLTAFIYNSHSAGFKHEDKHPKFYPDQVMPTPEEEKSFWTNGVGSLKGKAQKFSKKILDAFDLRRCVSVHMFSRREEWHCFYFSYEDMFGNKKQGKNHWQFGDHIHYVSHHWGLNKEEVWNSLDKRQSNINSTHIRYIHL